MTAPIEPTLTFEQARTFVRAIAERIEAGAPDRYTTRSSLAVRPGRIYLDYARNGLGATAVGCYSPRARPGFPVATPVTWSDIEAGMKPGAFSLAAGSAQPMPKRSSRQRKALSR